MEELVAIAKIAKPRGIRGEVSADVLTDFPERFEGLETVIAVLPDGLRRELKIENFRFQNKRILLSFNEIDSIESAETLRDAEVCIPESEAVALEEDEFYDWQLVDCQVETVEGEKIGVVKKLMRTGGTELLVVAGAEKEFLIPFAETICTEIDIENKLILLDAPEGLLEF
ncbi:MAG: ribosome maturation factor RimM [Pyrinomonadaceae bacterium]